MTELHETESLEEAQEGRADQKGAASAAPQLQQKSRVVKPGEKRSKKGKRRINSGVPPPLAPDDYVKVVPVSKQSEVSFRPCNNPEADEASQKRCVLSVQPFLLLLLAFFLHLRKGTHIDGFRMNLCLLFLSTLDSCQVTCNLLQA